MKKISVITINFNNAAGLQKTIESVADQQPGGVEFIVIDGGSGDGSVDVIKANQQNINYWITEKDNGIYHAQNKAVSKASGDYCLFLNSGDVLANENVINNFIQEIRDEDIVYGDIITRDKNGKETYLASPEKTNVYHFMLSTLWHPSAFIKRSLFAKFGLYNEDLKITGDYEFFIRAILKHNASTRHVKQAVCIFDLGGISNSPEMLKLQQEERKKSWELNFSKVVTETFEKHVQLLRSREYRLGRVIKRILRPF